jgi:hypothetical protein
MSPAQLAVLRQPWDARRNGPGLRLLLVTLLLVAVPVLALAHYKNIAAAHWTGALGMVWLSALWWVQVDGLLRQNRPDLALLLPGQRRALRRSLVVQGLLFGTGLVASFSLAFGLREEFFWLTVLLLPLLAWLQREPLLWFPLSLLSVAPLRLRGLLDALIALPLTAKAAVLLVLVVLLAAVIGKGGAWHRWLFARQRRWQLAVQAQTEGRAAPAVQGRFFTLLAACFNWPARLYRRALLRRPTPANALQRLTLGLEGGAMLPVMFWVLGLILGGLLLAAALVAHFHPDVDWTQVVDNGRFGLCIGLFSALCSGPMSRCTGLWGRRREQALLVLLPGLPQGAEQARLLETHWRQQQLLLWLIGACVALPVASLGSPSTLNFAAAHVAGCLPLVWLAQAQLRRLPQRQRPPGFSWWSMAPALMAIPAVMAERTEVPAWASLTAGVLVYVLCAALAGRPSQALLPVGRG